MDEGAGRGGGFDIANKRIKEALMQTKLELIN